MKLKYGFADECYKFRLDDEPRYGELDTLICARGDWAAFQFLINSDEEFSLSTGENPVFSPRGPISNVRMECTIEGLSEAKIAMNPIGLIEDDNRVPTADLLLNNEMVHVEKNHTQPVWIEIGIPGDTSPGLYDGTVILYSHSMFDDELILAELPFKVEVKAVTMPEPKEYEFHLDLWQHLSNIARKHEVRLWSDEHFKVIKNYAKSLAALGQKAVTIIASEIPWSGQRCFSTKSYLSDLFEYSMIKVEKSKKGRFRYDFSAMERYIDLCFKYGIDREIEVFGLINIWTDEGAGYGKRAEDYPDGIRVRYYDKTDGCYKYMKSAVEINSYIKALEKYFIKKGLIDKVLVVADEPGDVERYRESLQSLIKAAPTFRYKTAINHAEFINEFRETTNDFVPYIGCVCQEWEQLSTMKDKIKGRLLWYICCGPQFPNTFIGSPLVESRLIGIMTAFMNFDGFLRWNYTVWPENPRERIAYRSGGWPAGDTNFVYPANDGRPVLSLRYKSLKRGIEDYELIQLLRKKHPDAEKVLETLWEKVIKAQSIKEFQITGDGRKRREELYSLRYEDYRGFKAKLLEELARL